MTKLETLRHLPTSNDLRQSVSQMQVVLDETTQRLTKVANQVQQLNELKQLPDLITEQVIAALEPLTTLQLDVARALEAFDQVNQAQRTSLEALSNEIASKAAKSMQGKIDSMNPQLSEMSGHLGALNKASEALTAAANGVAAIPKKITDAASASTQALEKSSEVLSDQADRLNRNTLLIIFSTAAFSSLLTAVLVMVGIRFLN